MGERIVRVWMVLCVGIVLASTVSIVGTVLIRGIRAFSWDLVPWAALAGSLYIVIPAAVKEIGSDAFLECSMLVSVELPVGLKEIGGSAFAKCVSLREVIINAPQPPKMSKSTFKDVVLGACKFYVPKGFRNMYMQDKQWQKIPQLLEK